MTRKDSVVIAIVSAQTNEKVECEINRRLRNEITNRIPVLGFGASDWQENCWSHLLYFGEKNVMQKNVSVYGEKFGCKSVVINLEQKSQICPHSNLT